MPFTEELVEYEHVKFTELPLITTVKDFTLRTEISDTLRASYDAHMTQERNPTTIDTLRRITGVINPIDLHILNHLEFKGNYIPKDNLSPTETKLYTAYKPFIGQINANYSNINDVNRIALQNALEEYHNEKQRINLVSRFSTNSNLDEENY